MRRKAFGGWVLAGLVLCGGVGPAAALYLDEAHNISLRARIYSQASIRLRNSQIDTVPATKAGQLVQHRNFFNPELDARLTAHTGWMKEVGLRWLAPDDLVLRIAAWGFYDGIYDYGASQFDAARRQINSSFPDVTKRTGAFFLSGPTFNEKGKTIDEIFPGSETQNPRDIYARQRRINELYLSYAKGPLFLRIGRQAISWGESDTIALLDQNNPFDTTLGAPGIFQDLDESRIPLWALRSSVALFDTLGPFSSALVEAYWVPGDLDANTGILPLLTASPYSARGEDPQSVIARLPIAVPVQFVLFDAVPKKRFENSRWGVRAQTVVNRHFTLSAWYYTHFPNAPVPVARGLVRTSAVDPATRQAVQIFTTETVHDLTAVVGVSNSFFFEPLDLIVRMEAEYFDNEPGFVPEENLCVTRGASPLDILRCKGTVPKADFLRWELGLDRFFFFRPLNPTNSFTLVAAIVGSWNLDESSLSDFRFQGQRKPGTQGTSPDDFVELNRVEGFAQVHLQTDYLHGRLSPGITYIQNLRGTYAMQPQVTYRWRDWLLFDVGLIHIGGEYQQLGFFRDRDQISLRTTYQLN